VNVVYLNGRPALDWEIPLIERARQCERDRDQEQLAGVLSGDRRRVPDRPPKGRKLTVSDLDMEWLT
jgi:hypothetical protein